MKTWIFDREKDIIKVERALMSKLEELPDVDIDDVAAAVNDAL